MSFFDDPPLRDFPDHALRRLLENPANLRDLVTALRPDLAAHMDFDHVEIEPGEGGGRTDEQGNRRNVGSGSPSRSGTTNKSGNFATHPANDPRRPLRYAAAGASGADCFL